MQSKEICSFSEPLAKQHPAQSLCFGFYVSGYYLLPKPARSHMAEQSHVEELEEL